MKKESKKELLLFGGMFFGSVLLWLILEAVLFASSVLKPVSFFGIRNYFRLFTYDDTFRRALGNTALSSVATVLIPCLLAFLLSTFLFSAIKKKKTLFVLTAVTVVFAVGIRIAVFFLERNEIFYGGLYRMMTETHLIESEAHILGTKAMWFILTLYALFNALIAFGILNLCQLFINIKKSQGLFQNLIRIGGVFFALLLAVSASGLLTALRETPGTVYSAGTLTLADQLKAYNYAFNIGNVLAKLPFKLTAAVLLVFLFWCAEKIVERRKAKRSNSAKKISIFAENY